ncbi:MAG: type II toxin-antitoxin system Phd/YefM family antitoxin [Proteobacteria bacterium]|nr:type II toxin-antitoxin system Phd/YefM family antitoxin [Pseudomonadota bacterium]
MAKKPQKTRSVTFGDFKANCSALAEEVARTGRTIVITKRGKPVAQLCPVRPKPRTLFGAMKGRIEILGDIVGPIDVRWNARDE